MCGNKVNFFHSPCWGTTIIFSNKCSCCLIIFALTTIQFSLLCNYVCLILFFFHPLECYKILFKVCCPEYLAQPHQDLRAVITIQFFVQCLFQPTKYEIKHMIESDSRSMSVTYIDPALVFTRGWKLYLLHKTCEETRLRFCVPVCLIASPLGVRSAHSLNTYHSLKD